MDANDNNAPKIVAALQYDAGAKHRPALDGYTAAVIAVRFIAINQLLSASWILSSLASLAFSSSPGIGAGWQWRLQQILPSAVHGGFAITSAILLWLFANRIGQFILPRNAGRLLAPVNVQYSAIGIALIGAYSVINALPLLTWLLASHLYEILERWMNPPTGGITSFSSSSSSVSISSVDGRLITIGSLLTQFVIGIAVICFSRWLARLRVFRG